MLIWTVDIENQQSRFLRDPSYIIGIRRRNYGLRMSLCLWVQCNIPMGEIKPLINDDETISPIMNRLRSLSLPVLLSRRIDCFMGRCAIVTSICIYLPLSCESLMTRDTAHQNYAYSRYSKFLGLSPPTLSSLRLQVV